MARAADEKLRIAVAGASGRMGRTIVHAVLDSADCVLAAAFEAPGSPAVGSDAAALAARAGHAGHAADARHDQGLAIGDDAHAAIAAADVLIDFTRPAATLAHLALCRDAGVAAVVGTTGFSPQDRAVIAACAERVPLVVAPNMSVGVNVALRLAALAAAALGDGYDVEIVEAHHRHKVDAPSGTALAFGDAVARARGVDIATHGVFARHGHTGERAAGSIGFSTIRGGDIVGDHTVLFAGGGERVEITHRSSSRANYAEGSLRAARFVHRRAPGLYDMAAVLGLV